MRIGFLIVAGHFGSDDDLAEAVEAVQSIKIEDSEDGDDWRVNVADVDGKSLTAERRNDRIIDREVDGAPVSGGVFDVNGADLSSRIWSQLPI